MQSGAIRRSTSSGRASVVKSISAVPATRLAQQRVAHRAADGVEGVARRGEGARQRGRGLGDRGQSVVDVFEGGTA